MTTIAVIDYGMGNLHSISKALERASLGEKVVVTYDPDVVRKADRVVFPGVGGIRHCIDELHRLGLDEVLREVAENKPLLGICVGMQALLEHSDENDGTDCLGLLPGRFERFADNHFDEHGNRLKVPHMGWNRVTQLARHPIWDGIADGERFYFVHSYRLDNADLPTLQATSEYPDPFCCAVARDNLFAVQFHPEKSQQAGLTLLGNFCQWDGQA